MYAVEKYAAVRRFVIVEGNSQRAAARVFGISRTTVDKMCTYSAPPGYQRTKPPAKPKLDPFIPIIDAILKADAEAPKKQRHTAKRIFERLRDEHGYDGGYTIVADYVRETRQRRSEKFVPLHHPPGHAQVDFGEAIGIIGGERRKLHVFFMDLPYSDAAFMKAYPAETTEAFLDGHVSALAFFGGVPQSILYDNTKLAVARICGDGTRERTRAFTGLISHYLFRDRFGRPGKGNDKGKVEGLVKNGRRRFLTPVPVAASFEELNARLEAACLADQDRKAGRHMETIGERLLSDLSAFRPLPTAPFEPCEVRAAQVSSTSLVRYRSNDYSVPTTHGHRSVTVKGYVDEVVILAGSEEIARHPRSYERGAFVFDPLHYLALIEQKPGALDQAAPLQGWELPDEFGHLRRLLEARLGNKGKREFIQVLRLMEVLDQNLVALAVARAIKLGALSFDAVKQIAVARLERRPPQLDLERYPHLPKANVAVTRAADYAALMPAGTR
ncbi:MAG: IS21 family transposase [Methyloceanibacter sp.]|uniref:IS21 family transposase n=1 Tax=Methyloceanibacter sp. TaxID=1965321 RepID=UPI003C3E58D2